MPNFLQSFFQRVLGVNSQQPSIEKKSAGYVAFSDTMDYFGWSKNVNQETLIKSYKSWVYAAVSKRADEFSNLKLTLNRITKKGNKTEVKPVTVHPVLELLDKVNPYLSFNELLKINQIYKDLTGSAYWWLVREGNKITEIWPYLRPDRMTPIPSAENFIDGYKYTTPNGGIEKFESEDIIHFKYPNPENPYQGVSPLEASYLAYNTYMRSSEWNNRFFANEARADFILNIGAELTDDQTKQFRTQWENRHKGAGHEHRMAILSGSDAKVLTTGLSAKDMEFIEQMKFTRDEILALFKVPKALLDPQELNYASARVAKEVFLNEVIIPLMKDFVSVLNEFLLPNYNDDSLFFDFESPAEENPEAKNAWIASRVAAGAIAPNEVRAMDNLPPFEGGNNIYMPMMQVPVGGEVPQSQVKTFKIGTLNKIELPQKYHTRIKSKSTMAEVREQVEDAITKDLKKKYQDTNKAKKERILPKVETKKSERDLFNDALWQAKIIKTSEDERKMRALLNKEFVRQQRQVINSLHEKTFTFRFDVEDEQETFVKIFTPYFDSLIKKYGEDAMEMVNMSDFSMSDRAKDWLADNVNKFSEEVNKTTQAKIRDALSKAVEEGEGVNEAAKRVREVFQSATTARSKAIARTEILHSSNFASVEAWKQSEVVEKKEWYTALDERVCPICEPLHGKVIRLDNEFASHDELFGNVEEPPAHVSCRCTLLPVLKSKEMILSETKQQAIQEVKKSIEEIRKEGQKEIGEVKKIKDKLNRIIIEENNDG